MMSETENISGKVRLVRDMKRIEEEEVFREFGGW